MSANFTSAYNFAKCIVCDDGYFDEIQWQKNLKFENIDESTFLKELSWVIISSGMKEKVARKIFVEITPIFHYWHSAKSITMDSENCRRRAQVVFKHEGKIAAIIDSAKLICARGYRKLKNEIQKSPIDKLLIFPYIGKITSFHLAKNIGLPVAKPDRHLTRIADMAGYDDVQEFCSEISKSSGDTVPVVDIVLWRFATIEKDYLRVLNNVQKQAS